jgi:hypothetical protein
MRITVIMNIIIRGSMMVPFFFPSANMSITIPSL